MIKLIADYAISHDKPNILDSLQGTTNSIPQKNINIIHSFQTAVR